MSEVHYFKAMHTRHRLAGSSAQNWLKYDKMINPGLSLQEHKHVSSTPKLILDATEPYLFSAWTNKPWWNASGLLEGSSGVPALPSRYIPHTGCLVFPNNPWKDDGNINTELVTSQLWSSCFNSCQTSPQSVVYPLQQKRMTECKNKAWQPKWLRLPKCAPGPTYF